MVAIALAGGLYTMGATITAARAAAATVFMSGHDLSREFALIRAAGSTHAAITLTAIWEAVIYTVTAAILGTVITVVGGFIIAVKLAVPSPVVSFATLGLIVGGGFVLILAATVVPTASALRHEVPRTLAVE